MPLTCDSQITQVTVHARGALVRRQVLLPATLPAGELDVLIPGVTLLSEAGSLRAAIQSKSRAVVSVRSSLHVPETPPVAQDGVERLRALEAQIERLQAEHGRLAARRKQIVEQGLDPLLRPASHWERLERRLDEALSTAQGLAELAAEIDERLVTLAERLQDLIRERDALQLQISQSSQAGRAGQPTRRVLIHLSGDGPIDPGGLEISYVVLAARFWPLYTVRIGEGGKRAEMLLEALVAQRTGEDWTGVRLGLSTADLLYDARLPELQALRFGRAQPAPRRAYRPPPEGLSRMFAGYDAAFADRRPPPAASRGGDGWQDVASSTETMRDALDDESTGVYAMPPLEGAPASNEAPRARSGGPPQDDLRRSPPRPGAPPPPPMAMPVMPQAYGGVAPAGAMPMQAGAPMMVPSASRAAAPAKKSKGRGLLGGGGGGGHGAAPMDSSSFDLDEGEAGGSDGSFGGFEPVAPVLPEAVEPADAWLDFDSLTLGGPGDARRGVLSQQGDPAGAAARRRAVQHVESVTPGPGLRDPRATRGMFDHRYEADGLAEVPADGKPHRLALATAAGAPALRLRTVPRETAEVYREIELKNPFDAPLLAGPVDVYLEGSLLAVTSIDHVDRGGALKVGMGVEDRVRVARNTRVEEEAAGVLGGSVAVTHTVTIDLTSSLGSAALVEVVDRIPVTDDKSVEIKRLGMRPEGEPYKQVDRGQPVRGGWLWRVTLPPGGKGSVEFQYRIVLSAKSEIIGGNRRE